MNAEIAQGTKFGPIGFIVMINDLAADIKFIDDCTLIETMNTVEHSTFHSRLQVAKWTKENKMLINCQKKTNEMRISFQN